MLYRPASAMVNSDRLRNLVGCFDLFLGIIATDAEGSSVTFSRATAEELRHHPARILPAIGTPRAIDWRAKRLSCEWTNRRVAIRSFWIATLGEVAIMLVTCKETEEHGCCSCRRYKASHPSP